MTDGDDVARVALAEVARSAARLRVLAEASHAFASAVTDHDALLLRIAQSVAELVGDGCLVTLLDADGVTLVTPASAHRDPALDVDYAAYARSLPTRPATESSVSATVIRTGEPRLVPAIDPQMLVMQSEPALRPLLTRLNVHSFIVVPIRARSEIIGALSIMRSRPGESYTPDDVVLLQDLGDRAGLALANARAYVGLEQRVRQRTAQLEAANAELESFSYSVAHDLRTPLRAIDGFAHALVEDQADLNDAAKGHLARIRKASQDMARLIDDLLGLARTTRAELRVAHVDLSAMARRILASSVARDPERRVDIVVEDGLVAEGDEALLEIVMTNLLDNAWKFTSKRAHASIQFVAQGASRDTFVVRDDGVGFDPAYAGKLFGVFQRLHTHTEFEGTGIGLATVRRVVQRHGGRTWAESSPGAGAAIFFRLAPDR